MTFLEKAIDGFLRSLFERWKERGVNHLVTIIIFCRTFNNKANNVRDYYSLVVDWEIFDDWMSVLPRIRVEAQEMVDFIGGASGDEFVTSFEGNFLEATHVALSIFDRHYVDRDLNKTGMSVICITPGSGAFLIKQPNSIEMSRLAKQKILDSGIWVQLVSLTEPPLHVAPLFKIEDLDQYYEPYWINASFYNCKSSHYSSLKDEKEENVQSVFGGFPASMLSMDSVHSVLSAAHDQYPATRPAYNPFDPTASSRHCSLCCSRWGTCRSSFHFGSDDTVLFDWRDFVIPPCFPLHSILSLQMSQLTEDFELVKEQHVSLQEPNLLLSDNPSLAELMDEMVNLRIALGYQEIQIKDFSGKALCFSHEIHLLDVDQSGHVKTHVYKRKPIDVPENWASIQYKALFRCKSQDEFCEKEIIFQSFRPVSMKILQMDCILSGVNQHEIRQGTYWQSRFVLIPAKETPRSSLIMATAAHEILDDEELRMAGFYKFIKVFQRIALSKPTPSSKGSWTLKAVNGRDQMNVSAIEFLKIVPTTATGSAYAQQEFHQRSMGTLTASSAEIDDSKKDDPDYVADVIPLTKSSDVQQMVVLMQHPLVGMNIRNRRWHWRVYRNVFVGSEAVDWILKFFDDVQTREEAISLGDYLLDLGVWEHIFGTHRFLDGYYYYRFAPEYDLGTLRKSDPHILQSVSSKKDLLSNIDEEAIGGSKKNSAPDLIVMSRSVLVNVDATEQARREWAILHYDSIHNPKVAYHFRLHWLTCSARLIDELIQSWARRAIQCGFLLVEAPASTTDSYTNSSNDTLCTPLTIEFSVKPPSLQKRQDHESTEDYFVSELLFRHDFIQDLEGDDKYPKTNERAQLVWSYERGSSRLTQFIHQSGVAFVSILPDQRGLLWSINRLLLSSVASRNIRSSLANQYRTLMETEERVRKELIGFCSEPMRLEAFWNKKRQQISTPSPEDDQLRVGKDMTPREASSSHSSGENND